MGLGLLELEEGWGGGLFRRMVLLCNSDAGEWMVVRLCMQGRSLVVSCLH